MPLEDLSLGAGNCARKVHCICAFLLSTHQWTAGELEALSKLYSVVLLQICFRFPISILRWAVWDREEKLDGLKQGTQNLVSFLTHSPRTPAYDYIKCFSFHWTGWTTKIRHSGSFPGPSILILHWILTKASLRSSQGPDTVKNTKA